MDYLTTFERPTRKWSYRHVAFFCVPFAWTAIFRAAASFMRYLDQNHSWFLSKAANRTSKRRYLADRRLFSRELEDLKKTLDVTGRFLMLDMRWKALERAVNLSQVSAQGDAIFLAFSRREEPYIIAQNTS